MSAHDTFAEAAAAYALDALDPQEAQQFEAHLATCAACREELVRYQQVVVGLASTVTPEEPPPSLRARTLARAFAGSQVPLSEPGAAVPRPHTWHVEKPDVRAADAASRSAAWGWRLALAASLAIIVGLGAYASTQRGAAISLRAQLADALGRLESLRAELVNARRDADRLATTANVVNAPDLVAISLRGQAGAPAAAGRALVSRGRGLIFRAAGLPAPAPGRVYQLWVIPPSTPGVPAVPVGAGILTAEAGGGFVLDGGPLPAGVAAVQLVAVTEEPGPTGSPGPTTPILLLGQAGG
jgi:anti-sigma-K factor RskA